MRSRRERGNSLVELALISSLLFLIMFGVIDFGRMFAQANIVASAARAGTQYGFLDGAHTTDYAGMQTAALNDAQNAAGVTATASQVCTCGTSTTTQSCSVSCSSTKKKYVQVVVTATYTTMATWPGIPSSTPMSSTSLIRIE